MRLYLLAALCWQIVSIQEIVTVLVMNWYFDLHHSTIYYHSPILHFMLSNGNWIPSNLIHWVLWEYSFSSKCCGSDSMLYCQWQNSKENKHVWANNKISCMVSSGSNLCLLKCIKIHQTENLKILITVGYWLISQPKYWDYKSYKEWRLYIAHWEWFVF